MEKYLTVFKGAPLMQGIGDEEIITLLNCLGARRRAYGKGAMIYLDGDTIRDVGIVLTGQVHVIREDSWGNRTIIARVDSGQMFGESYVCAGAESLPVSVQMVTAGEVLFIDYGKIITSCSSACTFHNRLIKNMLRIIAQKNLEMNRKIDHIAKRTTRAKLLSYLAGQAPRQGGRFHIPFDRQELADYLCVDRSAMSKELGRMRDEGLIAFHKNEFELFRWEA